VPVLFGGVAGLDSEPFRRRINFDFEKEPEGRIVFFERGRSV
jgi:hypothetical protein